MVYIAVSKKRNTCPHRTLVSKQCPAASASFLVVTSLSFMSLQAVTQLELFGDMSTPPDITSPPVSMHWPLSLAPLPFSSSASQWPEEGLWAEEAYPWISALTPSSCVIRAKELVILNLNFLLNFKRNYDTCFCFEKSMRSCISNFKSPGYLLLCWAVEKHMHGRWSLPARSTWSCWEYGQEALQDKRHDEAFDSTDPDPALPGGLPSRGSIFSPTPFCPFLLTFLPLSLFFSPFFHPDC